MSDMMNDMILDNMDEMEELLDKEELDELDSEMAQEDAVGYSPESIDNAYRWYESLPEGKREAALREHSRNAHIMRVELSREKAARQEVTDEQPENRETVGYDSGYYEHRMEVALKNGNKIAYDNAKSDWARAKARETAGTSSEMQNEQADNEAEITFGHSSKYYLNKMADALERGSKRDYEAAKKHWSEAVAEEEAEKVKK